MQPQLTAAGVRLAAVLHEKMSDRALQGFAGYFSGPLYLDVEKRFFGPQEQRLGIVGILRINTYWRLYEAWKKGVSGNMKGDGTLLGAVYMIGSGNTGGDSILFEHRERDFGDHHNNTLLMEAISRIHKSE